MERNAAAVKYSPTHLNISIKTTSASAMHYQLMQGLATALQQAVNLPENGLSALEGINALALLLKALVPTEGQLQKAMG
jgi:hypothetical protein